MKIWLDDERFPPNTIDWVWVTTAEKAKALLETGLYDTVSLDHDLGPVEAGTGYDVASWLECRAVEGKFIPATILIHSANPVGRKNMEAAIKAIDKYRLPC